MTLWIVVSDSCSLYCGQQVRSVWTTKPGAEIEAKRLQKYESKKLMIYTLLLESDIESNIDNALMEVL